MKKNHWKKKLIVGLVLGMLLGAAGVAETKMPVYATDEAPKNEDFSIQADLISCDERTYEVQVTVLNTGKNWEGTVRLIPEMDYATPGAYDVPVSLPSAIAKQFVVTLPKWVDSNGNDNLRIALLDNKGKVETVALFPHLLADESLSLLLGILSDDYGSLTYLDMGGERFYYQSENSPVILKDLTKEKFADSLDELTFLVIDDYNTSVMSDEDREALELWVIGGGTLIVGTGENADAVLGGLHDYLLISTNQAMMQNANDWEEVAGSSYGIGAVEGLKRAYLKDEWGQYQTQFYSGGLSLSAGSGAIMVLPFSLKSLGTADFSAIDSDSQEDCVSILLDEASSNASARYNANAKDNKADMQRYLRRVLGFLGRCKNQLNFGLLKFVIVCYVIFVGPVLYLILMAKKKRELYWLAVPATTFVGVLLVFIVGRGFRIVDTEVYSVTVHELSNQGKTMSYLYCYDANLSEWSLKMNPNYRYVCEMQEDDYSDGKKEDVTWYGGHVKKEGEQFCFGIKPSQNFDSCYFYGERTDKGVGPDGQLIGTDFVLDAWNPTGTISNQTSQDMAYVAVLTPDNALYVYEGLKAGESFELATQKQVYAQSQTYHIGSTIFHDFIEEVRDDKIYKEDVDVLTALGVGICSTYFDKQDGQTVIIGVAADWDKTVESRCKETAYGCFYGIQ